MSAGRGGGGGDKRLHCARHRFLKKDKTKLFGQRKEIVKVIRCKSYDRSKETVAFKLVTMAKL